MIGGKDKFNTPPINAPITTSITPSIPTYKFGAGAVNN